MNLDLVLGMSCNNIHCLACDRFSSLAAHTASGVLVLLDTATNCQVKYIHMRQNTVSSANFSPDGKFIVTGEIGYRPAVRVWRVKDGQELAALYGHEFGIKSVLFCANTTHIISVGLEHDNEINLWAWPHKHRLATNKIVDIIKAVAYSDCGSYFVTAGIRHLKFWYPKMSLATETVPSIIPIVQCLYGRPGIMGECKQHTFIDVACGNETSSDFVYCVTRTGGLVIVRASTRLVHSHKNIEDWKSNCLKVQDTILFIGFSNGDIHMFDSISLHHLAALPAPTFFRQTCMTGGGAFTLVFSPYTTLLTTTYKNSSMCVWDLTDANNVKQKYVAVYHCKAITNFDIFTTKDANGQVRETLVTVSHDSTVRLWGIIIGNSICYDQLSILYTDATSQQATTATDSQNASLDNTGIITAVKVSPNKKFIVTGNKAGNICVYDRVTFEHFLTLLAHTREITCLVMHTDSAKRTILASGSRDRLIHIMDVNNEFHLISTLNIHSSSITVISLYEMSGMLGMISCAADRTISICTTDIPTAPCNKRGPNFQLSKCTTIMSTPTDTCVVPFTNLISVGCQDGYIRVLDMDLLQECRMFRGCVSEERQIHKVCLDAKGILLLTAASDKTINVISFATGEILLSLFGHTKSVTGLVFTSSGDHVISTSMDGCVFIWHISEKTLRKRFLKFKKQTVPLDETSKHLRFEKQGTSELCLDKKEVVHLKRRERSHDQISDIQSNWSSRMKMETAVSNSNVNKSKFTSKSATELSVRAGNHGDLERTKRLLQSFILQSIESRFNKSSTSQQEQNEKVLDRQLNRKITTSNIPNCVMHELNKESLTDTFSSNIFEQEVPDDRFAKSPRVYCQISDNAPARQSSSTTWHNSKDFCTQQADWHNSKDFCTQQADWHNSKDFCTQQADWLQNINLNKSLKSATENVEDMKEKAEVQQHENSGKQGSRNMRNSVWYQEQEVKEQGCDDDGGQATQSFHQIFNKVKRCPTQDCLHRTASCNFLHTWSKPVH